MRSTTTSLFSFQSSTFPSTHFSSHLELRMKMLQIFISSWVQVTLFISLLLSTVDLSQGQVCNTITWNGGSFCSEGLEEAYSYFSPDGQSNFTVCCDQEALISSKRMAVSCHTTACITDPNVRNPCSTLPRIIVDGQLVAAEYSEEMRDHCVNGNSGSRGVAAVCCPPDSADALLISAYGAEINEFPHQAKMTAPGHCGGTVYNKDYIITAAHCVTDADTGTVWSPDLIQFVLGTNIGSSYSATNTYRIREVIVHENYSDLANHPERNMQERNFTIHGPGKRIFNDIALLRLSRSIDFEANPNIRALRIAPENFNPKDYADQAVIVGWGTTDTLTLAEHLQKANVIIRSNEKQCFNPITSIHENGFEGGTYFFMTEFSNQLICIGGFVDGQFSPIAGRGDSGGAAICRGQDGYAVLCGVTSFGRDNEACRNDTTRCSPSVYASVSYFNRWLRGIAGEQDPSTFHQAYLYGTPVPQGRYANQVRITSRDGKSCGGTLIAPSVVVTSGHCVMTDDGRGRPELVITAGMRDLNEGSNQTYRPREGGVVAMEGFARWDGFDSLNENRRRMMDSPYMNNIAVVKLDGQVPINSNDLGKLPNSSSPTAAGPAVEVAFPLQGNRSASGALFQERNFNLLTTAECQTRLDRFERLNVRTTFNASRVLCGVERYSGGSICDRELGGGLFCPGDNGQEVLCGIQTFRMCELSMPSAFLNVNTYRNFIEVESSNP